MTDTAHDEPPGSEATGYGRPPVATRFAKGQSGNPGGRPRDRARALPYDAVLGQMVTIHEDGHARRMTAAEAFLLHMTKRGLEGDGSAARAAMAAIEKARAARVSAAPERIRVIFRIGGNGSVGTAMALLGMGTKVDRFSDAARLLIEPWLVARALARLGDRRLSREEQAVVVAATRQPKRVRWPAWWEVGE